jgi:hypothetical protein
MNARRIFSAVILTAVLWCPSELIHGQSTSPPAYTSFSAVQVSRERRYQVDARVRPFLFWIRKSNVGDGRLTWRRGADGSIGYELLVGSDPARTPRKINRWGYLREELSGNGAIALGVMSQSDEESVEDANKNTSRTDGTHAFKALQQSLTASQARVTISDVRVQRDLTYADLDALLSAVPTAPSRTKTVTMPEFTSPGFLAAAASLMEEGRTAAGKPAKAPHFVRTYPYNGQLYELRLRSADHVDQHTREGRSFGPAIRGRFSVLNLATGYETPFMVVYGVEGDLTGVPLLISWRPRWWFEVECALRND